MIEKIVVGAAVLAAVVAASPGLARNRTYVPPGWGDQTPLFAGVPNVPDEHGCVKWCFRDTGPCDPPDYKRADGRCDLND